jgi:RNA polymerase sigma-70 factor, ECF subfamily
VLQRRGRTLSTSTPRPIIALDRAIAATELDGREVALAAIDRLEDKLADCHTYLATRADLLRRVGRHRLRGCCVGPADRE